MKKIILVLFALMAFSYGQTPNERIQDFFKVVHKGEFDNALDGLIDGGIFTQERYSHTLLSLKSQIPNVINLSGTRLSDTPEKISEKDTSSVTKIIVYLEKYENTPLVWNFAFYQPKDKWELFAIYVNSTVPTSE